MSTVLFKRGSNAQMADTSIQDGLLYFNTEDHKIYMDNGSERLQYGGDTDLISNPSNATVTNVNVIISDCENYGNVGETKENYVSVGGIVGYSRATVKNSKNYGEIKGYESIGGIAGATSYYNDTSTLIENSKNYGSIVKTL